MNPRYFLIIFAALTVAVTSPVQAKHYKHYTKAAPGLGDGPRRQLIDVAALPVYPTEQTNVGARQSFPMGRKLVAPSNGYDLAEGVVSHPPGCPGRLFCGCGVSVKVFGHPIRDLYLARNWLQFPRTSPAAGMVAARSGHVFYIQSVNSDGSVVAWDPNSGGHLTRVHTVSLRGYVIVDPSGTASYSARKVRLAHQ